MPRDAHVHAVPALLPLSQLQESPTNHRRRRGFDAASLEELAQSIRTVGVLQPILVRRLTHPDDEPRYEVVAGARRVRAARLVEDLAEIPAIVRSLTDVEVLELQVIENSQREDPHPLDEAEGYAALCEAAGYSREQLAARLGKSRAHVYARLALAKLADPIKEQFSQGLFGAEIAGLIARLPQPLQPKALEAITLRTNDEAGAIEIESFRDARDTLTRRFALRLAEAPFDVTVELAGAPACGACPKRTGNEPELFADIQEHDTCLDPDCFAAKRRAHWAAQLEELLRQKFKRYAPPLEERGEDEAPGDFEEREDAPDGCVPADDQASAYGLGMAPDGKLSTVRDVMPKRVKPMIAERADGKPVLVYWQSEVRAERDRLRKEDPARQEQEKANESVHAARNRFDKAAAKQREARRQSVLRLCDALKSSKTWRPTGSDFLVLAFACLGDDVDEQLLDILGVPEAVRDEPDAVLLGLRRSDGLTIARAMMLWSLKCTAWGRCDAVDPWFQDLAKRLGMKFPTGAAK